MAVTDDEIRHLHRCPHCGALGTQPCVNTVTGKALSPVRGIHTKRRNQICGTEYLEFVTEGPVCAKLKEHRGQHATADGRTRWSRGAGFTAAQLRAIIEN